MTEPGDPRILTDEEAAAEAERQRQVDENYDANLRDHARMGGVLRDELLFNGFSTEGAEMLTAHWYEHFLTVIRGGSE